MRIFLAGATGVIGVRLVPLLPAAGHDVAGLTRSRPQVVRELGAEPVVCEVYDSPALREAMARFAPDLVLHQLTDLPDELADLERSLAANARIRDEGTRNLLAAAPGVRMLAQPCIVLLGDQVDSALCVRLLSGWDGERGGCAAG